MKKLICLILIAFSAVIAAALMYTVSSEDEQHSIQPRESITLYREKESKMLTIPYNELVLGCMFAELLPSYADEALKAAACVINSRCLYLLQNGERINGADISDKQCAWMSPEEAETEYGRSYSSYLKKLSAAAEYGMRHALYYEQQLISPAMCLCSTGRTDNGGVPYHSPKKLAADETSSELLSTSAYSADNIRRTLTGITGVSSLSARPSEWFSGAVYTDGGTLSEIRFGGARLTGSQLRDTFKLRSAAITIEYTEERFVFTVRGCGDNLGMSLNSAAELADSGMNAEEILEYFYSPAELMML
ncbi:MAG: hypothetical protein IJZ47_13595 [Oscillospiraceae bacterium]|nr:hypothetical protein [Oscillospiraceae bacterium]MBQ8196384.1 hypothetical protein [Oscillospiraceae bacterium]